MSEFDQQLQQIFQLRETKGQEQLALDTIAQLEPQVRQTSDFATLAKLCWEKAFVYQHLIMAHVEEDMNLSLMEKSALQAHDLVATHQLTDLVGDDTRFLGRLYDYKQDYPQALGFYNQALNFYQSQNHHRVLEIQGFISANLIYQNRGEEGLDLAKTTYADFDVSPLKQADFYKWAVWKTGIYPRIVKALISLKLNFDKNEIKAILESDKQMLVESGLDFQFRIDEISEALKFLQ